MSKIRNEISIDQHLATQFFRRSTFRPNEKISRVSLAYLTKLSLRNTRAMMSDELGVSASLRRSKQCKFRRFTLTCYQKSAAVPKKHEKRSVSRGHSWKACRLAIRQGQMCVSLVYFQNYVTVI